MTVVMRSASGTVPLCVPDTVPLVVVVPDIA
jgi:hypothetical protein